jgi:hypothetical protein
MAAQRLQKWLKTAADQATQDGTVNLHVADTGRALYLLSGSGADEADLYSPYRQIIRHARHARQARTAPASAELPIGCLVNRFPCRSRVHSCHG